LTALRSIVVYDGKAGQWKTISPGEQPAFSRDGSRIVAKSCNGGDCGLFVMGRDGSGRTRITTSADDFMPSWSPVDNRIAFASQSAGNWDVYVINADGIDRTRLPDDPAIDAMPVWLPNGQGIVFRSSRGGTWGIWIMNADGSNPRKIIDAPAGNDWGRDRFDVH
jgi:TolB protein